MEFFLLLFCLHRRTFYEICTHKIVIAQSTHNTTMGPMTLSKAKSTSSLSTKQTSGPTCLLKPVRTRDEHQPFITLASSGARSHSPHSMRKIPSALKDFGDKSSCSITDANFRTDSHSRSPNGMSKKEKYFNCSDSFTSPFLMTMPVMATGHYICRGTIGRDDSCHHQTHQDGRR